MKRWKTIESAGVYSVEYDTLNSTYAVFIQAGRFKHQISKTYYKKGWAVKAFYKNLANKSILIKE